MAKWWYNTKFHSSLKITLFEALYGHIPPQLTLGAVPKSRNQSANEVMKERLRAARILKKQLEHTQSRMKINADNNRREAFLSW
jgi:hypothetical protein